MWSKAYKEKNLKFMYPMNVGWVKSVDIERDLRILMSKDINNVRDTVYWQKIRLISRGLSYKSVEVISKLYRAYVRPYLEYCIQFWLLTNVKDADMVEGVQRRATKMIHSLRRIDLKDWVCFLSGVGD